MCNRPATESWLMNAHVAGFEIKSKAILSQSVHKQFCERLILRTVVLKRIAWLSSAVDISPSSGGFKEVSKFQLLNN